MVDGFIVGIDLGTTHSLIGTVRGGAVELITHSDGSVLLPSVVGASPGGDLLVGRRARNRRLLDPGGTVRSIKRRMGEDARVRVGRRELSPPEVSALILGALLDSAEQQLGARPRSALITVPAYFTEPQRRATLEAAALAELEVERLVNEPTAAALSYESGDEELALIYDLGGGTFDVSILERDEGFMEVKASSGDTLLGGDDIDVALADLVLATLDEREAWRVRSDPQAMTRLAEAVERAKIRLSKEDETHLHEPFLVGEGADAINLDRRLSREDVDAVAEPLVARTLARIDDALREANLRASDLDRLLLVGGASQMPIVARMVSDHLDMPVSLADEPDRAVAIGASILAGRAAGQAVGEVLVDITPFALAAGTVADELTGGEDLYASVVIPRGTVVPTRRTKTYYTMFDDQEAIEIPIAQGDATLLSDNTALGVVVIDDLPPSPERSEVDVELSLDLSGVLHVSATHRPSGARAETTIRRGPSRLTVQRREAVDRAEALRASEHDESGDVLAPEEAEDVLEVSASDARLARSLTKRAERALAEGALSDEARRAVEDGLERLRAATEAGGDLVDAVEGLTDVLYDLE